MTFLGQTNHGMKAVNTKKDVAGNFTAGICILIAVNVFTRQEKDENVAVLSGTT